MADAVCMCCVILYGCMLLLLVKASTLISEMFQNCCSVNSIVTVCILYSVFFCFMYFLGWSYLEHGWMCSRSSSTIAVAVYSIVICIYDGVYFVEKE